MYFHLKSSRSSRVLQLLESYRDAVSGQARNRVVLSLGDTTLSKSCWSSVARGISAKLYGQMTFLDEDAEVNAWVDCLVKRVEREGKWVPMGEMRMKEHRKAYAKEEVGEVVDGVLIDRIEHLHETTLGPELLGWHAWRKLKLDRLLTSLGFNQGQQVSAAVSVINRLVDPTSEHGLLTWLPTSSLADLLGEDVYRSDDRYYRVSDKLLTHQGAIEEHLQREVTLHFGFQRTVVLYDLTNTHFEGVCAGNEKARRGANKQKRFDCPQLVVAVCFDEYGFVLFHKVFAGNRGEVTTLGEILDELEKGRRVMAGLPSEVKPMLVMDAGLSSAANLELARKRGYSYLVNETRNGRVKYARKFAESDEFVEVKGRVEGHRVQVRVLSEEQVEQKKKQRPRERVILCHSVRRGEKERAMLSKAESKLVAALEKLREQITTGRLSDREKIDRKIGAALARHPRSARYYEVKVEKTGKKFKLIWARKEALHERAEALAGCYILRTNDKELSGEKLWHLYMSLTVAEAGFKALKSTLGLRPVFHQSEGRCQAHILITVLAYQLQRFITYGLELKADRRNWTTLRRVLQTHCYATLLVPTRDGRLYRIRKAGIPEDCHREIYQNLGVEYRHLPKTKVVVGTSAIL